MAFPRPLSRRRICGHDEGRPERIQAGRREPSTDFVIEIANGSNANKEGRRRRTYIVWPAGNIVPGVFTPVLANHSESFSLVARISVGVDRMQRNFEPMRKQMEAWQRSELAECSPLRL